MRNNARKVERQERRWRAASLGRGAKRILRAKSPGRVLRPEDHGENAPQGGESSEPPMVCPPGCVVCWPYLECWAR